MKRAQITVEYLIVLSAAFAFLALIVSSLSVLHSALLLSIDSISAFSLAENIGTAADQLELFGDLSEKNFEVRSLTGWSFISQNGNYIRLSSGQAEKLIALPSELAMKGNGALFSGRISVSLRKINGKLVLEVN